MESKTKKAILFIVTLNEIGGAQRFLASLISNLNLEKYDITAAAGDNSTGDFLKLFENPIKTYLIKNLKRDPNLFSDIRAIFEIRQLIKKSGAEVVFLNSSKAGFIGSLAAPKNVKVIYRIGGWSFNDPWPKWKKWLWVRLEKISAKWKDVIIVNNKHDFDQAQKLKIKPRGRLALIHNGLDVYKTELLQKDEARMKLFEKIAKYSGKVFQAKYIIGSIANFYPTKGLKYLIEAARNFKDRDDILFLIIGGGEERESLREQIQKAGLQNKVFLAGQLENGSKYLSAFDIFVLPSVKEGFPWALIEAMSAKLPVIATNVGAVPEIIENGKNGFMVEPGNSDQIAEKIKTILADDRLRLELGIQAHQTVLFKFPLDKMARQIEDLLGPEAINPQS